MKLIDKEKVVEEINSILNSYDPNEITSGRYALVKLREFLDTLEVKEVDLDKEIENWLVHGHIADTRYNDYDDNDIESTAKHFYELGMQGKENNK